MSARTRLLVFAAALLGALLLYRTSDLGAPADGDAGGTAVERRPATGENASADHDRRALDAQPATDDAPAGDGFDAIPAHAGLVRATLHGRVVDVTDRPVGGVEVVRGRPSRGIEGASVLSKTAPAARTDDAGRFELAGPLPMVVHVRDEAFVTVREGFAEAPDAEVLVVVARRIPLAGVVVTTDGAPIAGAQVSCAAEVALPGRDQIASRAIVPRTETDAQGAFRLDDVGMVPGASLHVQAAGYAAVLRPVPEGGDPALRVVLTHDDDRVTLIRGRVVLGDGSPAADAMVSTGVMAQSTDADGFFVIDFEPWLRYRVDETAPTVLTAVKPGLLPASRTLPSVQQARASGWPRDLVLRLDGAPREVAGVVVDQDGAPVRDALVEPADMTPFGIVSMPGMPAFRGSPRTLEQMAGAAEAQTDKDGRFRLDGLLDRPYRIRAMLRPSLLSVESAPVAAGTQELRLVLDRRQLGTIGGRIVDRHGAGIGGVRVSVSMKREAELVIGRSTVTAADGTFAIADATTTPAFLRIEGDAIVPELFRRLAPGDDVTALDLPVGRRCSVQFEWGAQHRDGDQATVEDPAGEPLQMMRLRGGSIGEAPFVLYRQGVSEVLLTSDAAAFAVVRRDGAEVTRVRLALAPVDVNVIRL